MHVIIEHDAYIDGLNSCVCSSVIRLDGARLSSLPFERDDNNTLIRDVVHTQLKTSDLMLRYVLHCVADNLGRAAVVTFIVMTIYNLCKAWVRHAHYMNVTLPTLLLRMV
jgi:hypothetical protein